MRGGAGQTPTGEPFAALPGHTIVGAVSTASSAHSPMPHKLPPATERRQSPRVVDPGSPTTAQQQLLSVQGFTRVGRRADNVVVCMSRKLRSGSYETYELMPDGSFGVVRFCKTFDGALLWHETLMQGSTIRRSQ